MKGRLSEKDQKVKQIHSIYQNIDLSQEKALEAFSKWQWNGVSLFSQLYTTVLSTDKFFNLFKMSVQ